MSGNLIYCGGIAIGSVGSISLTSSFSYETKQSTPAIWVTYNVTPHNVEGEISLGVTFKFYQDGKLIDTKDLSIDNESTVTDSFEWKYFSDTGDD